MTCQAQPADAASAVAVAGRTPRWRRREQVSASGEIAARCGCAPNSLVDVGGHRHRDGTHKGTFFVSFGAAVEGQAAARALHNMILPGATRPLTVRPSNTRNRRGGTSPAAIAGGVVAGMGDSLVAHPPLLSQQGARISSLLVPVRTVAPFSASTQALRNLPMKNGPPRGREASCQRPTAPPSPLRSSNPFAVLATQRKDETS